MLTAARWQQIISLSSWKVGVRYPSVQKVGYRYPRTSVNYAYAKNRLYELHRRHVSINKIWIIRRSGRQHVQQARDYTATKALAKWNKITQS